MSVYQYQFLKKNHTFFEMYMHTYIILPMLRDVMVIVLQNLDETVCHTLFLFVFHITLSLGKGMNLIIPPVAMRKF